MTEAVIRGLIRLAGMVSMPPLGSLALGLFSVEAPQYPLELILTSVAGVVLWLSSELAWHSGDE